MEVHGPLCNGGVLPIFLGHRPVCIGTNSLVNLYITIARYAVTFVEAHVAKKCPNTFDRARGRAVVRLLKKPHTA
jgi:hypothetical protein